MSLVLGLASDHGGFDLKEALFIYLESTRPEYTLKDYGTDSKDSVDYPDIVQPVAEDLQASRLVGAIIVCGTGIGVSIAANRYKGLRAAVVHNDFTAKMAKAHNNANILCMGGRTTDLEDAKKFVDIWLDTKFEGGRHDDRLSKIDELLSEDVKP